MAAGSGETTQTRRRVQSAYVPVVICGKLAFRYDPHRHVVEWQARGETHYIDLTRIEEMTRDIDKRAE